MKKQVLCILFSCVMYTSSTCMLKRVLDTIGIMVRSKKTLLTSKNKASHKILYKLPPGSFKNHARYLHPSHKPFKVIDECMKRNPYCFEVPFSPYRCRYGFPYKFRYYKETGLCIPIKQKKKTDEKLTHKDLNDLGLVTGIGSIALGAYNKSLPLIILGSCIIFFTELYSSESN